MKTAFLIFPHHLIENLDILNQEGDFFLIEEYLFFNQYDFHKQKLWFHRASLKSYEQYLISKSKNTYYIDSIKPESDIRLLIPSLKAKGYSNFVFFETVDNWLLKHILEHTQDCGIKCLPSPLFINSSDENKLFFQKKKRMFQADFYIYQRKKLGILVDAALNPLGEKWSFDAENRKKYPAKKLIPKVHFPENSDIQKEAKEYINHHYNNNYGEINSNYNYPVDFKNAKLWLNDFLENRFLEFGEYEDAIVKNETILHHSLLSPLINVGLLSPNFVVNQILKFSSANNIPINSTEGLIRQLIGWREYIRAVYELKGTEERTLNYWNFKRKIPRSFYDGTTGIEPIDTTIKKILKTGYCHHIERLMILGNFMLLCEFDPNEVYKWFMELFIDAYDWVMVPNVYGMSQFADGGLMSTKPYISGSNYLMKMSDYSKGPWQEIWDALYWRFIDKQRIFFSKNPRSKMMLSIFDKMSLDKKELHLEKAEGYLISLNT
jgi:deoxyribodipyrimidine photolyase-related protein